MQDDLTCPMGWSGVAPGVSFHAPQRLMLGWITQNSAFLKTAAHPNIFPYPLQSPPASDTGVCVWRYGTNPFATTSSSVFRLRQVPWSMRAVLVCRL